MFCFKICFFGAGAGRSRAFVGGAGAEIFLPGAGAEKIHLEPEPRKIGSAPQHWL